MTKEPELTEEESDTRRGYGCLAIAAIPVALLLVLFGLDQWQADRRIKDSAAKDRRFKEYLAQLPDPFGSNAIVYSIAPLKDVTGTSHKLAIGSTNLDAIMELAKREHSIEYQIAINEGRVLLNKPPLYDNDFKEEYAQYVLDLHEQKKILFLPLDTQLQIIKKVDEGIFRCRVLQPGNEGLELFMQAQYLTSKATNRIPDEFLIK